MPILETPGDLKYYSRSTHVKLKSSVTNSTGFLPIGFHTSTHIKAVTLTGLKEAWAAPSRHALKINPGRNPRRLKSTNGNFPGCENEIHNPSCVEFNYECDTGRYGEPHLLLPKLEKCFIHNAMLKKKYETDESLDIPLRFLYTWYF